MDRPLEQKLIKQRLKLQSDFGVKLLSAVDPQIILKNAGKQFSTCKYKKCKLLSVTTGKLFEGCDC